MPALTAAGITGIVALITTAVGAASAGTASAVGNSRKVRRATNAIESVNDALKSNSISFASAIERINRVLTQTGGEFKSIMEKQLKSGLASINDKFEMGLEQIDFRLKEAKEEATFQEKREIEKSQKIIGQLRSQASDNSEKIRSSLIQRGLVGGPLVAAISKNQETFQRGVFEVNELSSKVTENIQRNLSQLQRSGVFETGQLTRSAAGEERTFRTDLTTGLQSQLANLNFQGAQLKENRAAQFEQIQNQLVGEGIKLKADGGGGSIDTYSTGIF